MLPYQAVAMDYTGYQRQQHHHHQAAGGVGGGMPPSAASHMGHMAGALGIGGPSPFAHSWLMPASAQDMCGSSPYGKQMGGGVGVGGGQHAGVPGGPGAMQQPQDPGHVNCKLNSN